MEVTSLITQTNNHLLELHAKINEEVASVNNSDLHTLIAKLHTDSNLLTTKAKSHNKDDSPQLSVDVKKNLLSWVDKIRHTETLQAALGGQDALLRTALKKIEAAMEQFQYKVESVSNDGLRGG